MEHRRSTKRAAQRQQPAAGTEGHCVWVCCAGLKMFPGRWCHRSAGLLELLGACGLVEVLCHLGCDCVLLSTGSAGQIASTSRVSILSRQQPLTVDHVVLTVAGLRNTETKSATQLELGLWLLVYNCLHS